MAGLCIEVLELLVGHDVFPRVTVEEYRCQKAAEAEKGNCTYGAGRCESSVKLGGTTVSAVLYN